MRVSANAVIIKDGSILLISFNDEETGFHYNLPGGGVNPSETVHEALRREAFEEACAEIEVGRLLLVTEYEPKRNDERYGALHKLGLFFACTLKGNKIPHLPAEPDPHQVNVEWVTLDQFPIVPLLPRIASQLLAVYQGSNSDIGIIFI